MTCDNQTFCGNDCTIFLSQIIVRYTFNLHSAMYQLYLNKPRQILKIKNN